MEAEIIVEQFGNIIDNINQIGGVLNEVSAT